MQTSLVTVRRQKEQVRLMIKRSSARTQMAESKGWQKKRISLRRDKSALRCSEIDSRNRWQTIRDKTKGEGDIPCIVYRRFDIEYRPSFVAPSTSWVEQRTFFDNLWWSRHRMTHGSHEFMRLRQIRRRNFCSDDQTWCQVNLDGTSLFEDFFLLEIIFVFIWHKKQNIQSTVG